MSGHHEQQARLHAALEPFIVGRGYELVDLQFVPSSGRSIVRVLADHPAGGITMEECARLNRDASDMLEGAGLLPERSILEVSSPGLDRPLRTKQDFLRCLNRPVRFFFTAPLEGVWELEATVEAAEEEAVCVAQEEKRLRIPLAQIVRARQVV